jgi:hypothetical protein
VTVVEGTRGARLPASLDQALGLTPGRQRADTLSADVEGLVRGAVEPVAASWPLVAALRQDWGEGKPLAWLASPPSTESPTLEKATLVGTTVRVSASMGTPRTAAAYTDVSRQAATNEAVLAKIVDLLGAQVARDVDRQVAAALAALGTVTGTPGEALELVASWPGPRLVVLAPMSFGELGGWLDYADGSDGAIDVICDPYIDESFCLATAGVALGILGPKPLVADNPSQLGTDVSNVVTFALEAGTGAVATWTGSGTSGGGGGGGSRPPLVQDGPFIAEIVPVYAEVGPPADVPFTVNGQNFDATCVIWFDGAAMPTTFVSASRLTTVIPAGSEPAVRPAIDVQVRNGAGDVSNLHDFAIVAASATGEVPDINSLEPTGALIAPEPGTVFLRVLGTQFDATAQIIFDGVAHATTFVSSTELTCDLVRPVVVGMVLVQVVNGTGSTSNTQEFHWLDVNSPLIATIDPLVGLCLPEPGNQPLTIDGQGFDATAIVRMDGIDQLTTFVSANQLTAQLTRPALPGTAMIEVVNTAGTGLRSNAVAFTWVEALIPLITQLDPPWSPLGPPANLVVRVLGTGFQPDAVVNVDGVAVITTPVSDTEVRFFFQRGTELAQVLRAITVTNVAAANTSNAVDFAFIAVVGLPTITSIVPWIGPEQGGNRVRITGDFMFRATGATIDGIGCTNLVPVLHNVIECDAPPHPIGGPYDVAATTPEGTATLPAAYTYVSNLILTNITPDIEDSNASFLLVANGLNFINGDAVALDGVVVPTLFISGTELHANVTVNDPPGWVYTVTVKGTQGESNGLPLVIRAALLWRWEPPTNPAGTNLGALTGFGDPAIVVSPNWIMLDGRQYPTVTNVGGQWTAANIPGADFPTPGAVVDGWVQQVGGEQTNHLPWYITDPAVAAPTLTSLTPDTSEIKVIDTVIAIGTGFVNGCTILYEGRPYATTFVSATEVHFDTSIHWRVGTHPIKVRNPDMQESNALDFTVTGAVSILRVEPDQGRTVGGELVTLTGSFPTPATNVLIDGINATNVVNVSPTEVTALTPPHTAGGPYDVEVICGADGDTRLGGFTYVTLDLASILPTSGPAVETGATLTCTGADFIAGDTIYFDESAQATTFVDATTLTCVFSVNEPADRTFQITVRRTLP